MAEPSTRDLALVGDGAALEARLARLAHDGDWEAVVELRDLCRVAAERGHQLWPLAAHAEYRMALEAPGPYAAAVVDSALGRFTPGPLAEVAAATHTWTELAEHLPPAPAAALVAHERVLRGEDLEADGRIDRAVLDLPLALQPWEPHYALAEYELDDARFPAPATPALSEVVLPARGAAVVADPDATGALTEVVRAWTTESDGRVEAVAVEGGALEAIAALGLPRARVAPVPPDRMLAHLAWAGASGGAHGRRRGAAAGRFSAWWAAAAVSGMVEDWPVAPGELGEAISELRWWVWDPGGPETGWRLRIAVDDPADGLAWALSATDAR